MASEIEKELIDQIISAYHTTRLSDVPAAVHILSKDAVQKAFANYAATVKERCALACEQEAEGFLSPEYAVDQPLSSFNERSACGQCALAIRALP